MSSPAIAPHPAVAGRSLLTLRHHPPDAVAAILDLADRLKAERASGWPPLLAGRVVALIFERPSTRTRVSFASGIARLGGTSLALSAQDMQLGRGETVEDTAKVLGRMVDAIVLRTGPHATLEELDRHAGVPVVNGLTYEHHPCQALADAQTLRERFGDLSGLRVAYLGDGNNCCVSLMIIGALTGMAGDGRLPRGLPARPRGRRLGRRDGPRAGRLGRGRRATRAEAVGGRARPLHRHLGLDGRRGHARRARIAALEPYRRRRRAAGRGGAATPWRSTASRPTTARRSRTRSSTGRGRPSGTRPRTACTPRPPCSPTCWRSPGRRGAAGSPRDPAQGRQPDTTARRC